MKLLLKTIIICLLFSTFLISQELITENSKSNPVTILFVGNSYIYYGDSLHNHFKRMVEEYLTDYDGGASVKSATIGGARLKHHDVELNEETYALNRMIQWLWRGCIRNDQEMYVYIPSRRMRHLFLKWLGYTEEELF